MSAVIKLVRKIETLQQKQKKKRREKSHYPLNFMSVPHVRVPFTWCFMAAKNLAWEKVSKKEENIINIMDFMEFKWFSLCPSYHLPFIRRISDTREWYRPKLMMLFDWPTNKHAKIENQMANDGRAREEENRSNTLACLQCALVKSI